MRIRSAWPWVLLAACAIVFVGTAALAGANVWIALAITLVALVSNGAYTALADDYIADLTRPGTMHNPRYVRIGAFVIRAGGLACSIMLGALLSAWAFG